MSPDQRENILERAPKLFQLFFAALLVKAFKWKSWELIVWVQHLRIEILRRLLDFSPLIISRARKTADWDLQGGSAKRSPWVVIVKLCDPIRTTKRSSWPLDDTKSSPFFYFYAAISDGVWLAQFILSLQYHKLSYCTSHPFFLEEKKLHSK